MEEVEFVAVVEVVEGVEVVEELAVVVVVEAPHPTVAKNVFYDVPKGLKRSKRVKKRPKNNKKIKKSKL